MKRHSAPFGWRGTAGAVWLVGCLSLAVWAGNAGAADEGEVRLALVVDDFGHRFGQLARDYIELPSAVVLSIIPNTPFAKEFAEAAGESGHPVMVHLPMEPRSYPDVDPGDGAIMVADADSTVRRKIREALAALPQAEGLNNHMGSRAMCDERIVRLLVEELGARGMYLLDSHTGDGSPSRRLARAASLPYAENWLFWDTGRSTPEQIEAALGRLVSRARRAGSAIGIGHPRRESLEALKAFLASPAAEGVRLVPLSELLERGPEPAQKERAQ